MLTKRKCESRIVTLQRQMGLNDIERDAKSFSTLQGLALQDLISLQLRSNLKLQIIVI